MNDKTLAFIEKAKLVHSTKYNYDLVNYVNNSTKVNIGCLIHGVFEQIPASHLIGRGCPICGKLQKALTKMTIAANEFVQKANVVHNNKYDYSKTIYTGNMNLVVINCAQHGEFEIIAYNHLSGRGCQQCGYLLRHLKHYSDEALKIKQDDFILRSKEIHGDKYNYDNVVYLNNHTKVNIICNIHGEFKQEPMSHLKGHGCQECAVYRVASRENFVYLSKNRVCSLYIIHCFNDNESFYKIGITSKSIIERFSSAKYMPYKYNIVQEVHGSAKDIYNLEFKLHYSLRHYKYIPMKYFSGHTECFTKLPDSVTC